MCSFSFGPWSDSCSRVIYVLECFIPIESNILIARNHEGSHIMERLADVLTPSEPSFWNNPAFDDVDFADHFFSFYRNFPDDFQMFHHASHTIGSFVGGPTYEMFLGGESVKGETL